MILIEKSAYDALAEEHDEGDCACRIDFDDVEIKRDNEGQIYYSTGGNKARKAIAAHKGE